ncbi:MAG: hypothetical protein RL324_2397 [Verrucomicrobiota bacterium]|jgi:uncharacterized membrane protein
MITKALQYKLVQRLYQFSRVVTMLAVIALCVLVLPHPAGATLNSSSKHSKSSSGKSTPSKSTSSKVGPEEFPFSKSQDRNNNGRDDNSSYGSNHSSGGSQHSGDSDDDDHDSEHHYGSNEDDQNDCGSGGGSGGVVLVPVNILNSTGSQLIVTRGNSATLTAQLIAGSAPVTYQWMKRDTLGAFSAIPGATSLTLTIFNTTAADAGQYWIVATNVLGSMVSTQTQIVIASTLTILNTTGTNVQILPGTSGTLTAQLISGTQPVTYQWMKRDASGVTLAVPGATSLTLAITNAVDSDTGLYWIVATNESGSVASDGTQVQVALVNE